MSVLYPNLVELYKYHPYHYSTFAGFANVTPELYIEALKGNAVLLPNELRGIAKYTGIPLGVISCPKLIMLDKYNRKHKAMIDKQEADLYAIWELQKQGYKDADLFMKYSKRTNLVNLQLAFYRNEATYGWYLGVQESIDSCFLSVRVEQDKSTVRGLK